MKSSHLTFMLLAAGISFTVTITSCQSNNSGNQQANDSTSKQSSNLMQEGPAYDVTKIDPNAAVTTISMKTVGNNMGEMKFDQTELHVKAGTTVKFALVNSSTDASMQHNFVLIEKGTADKVGPEALKAGPDNNYVPKLREVLVHTKLIGPGQSTEITFPAPPKGEYDFICTYPGHYTIMKGKLFVE